MVIALGRRYLELCIHHYNSSHLVISVCFNTNYIALPIILLLEECFRTVLLREFEVFFLFPVLFGLWLVYSYMSLYHLSHLI